ncbi:MAG: hypothetical protein IAE79_17905 [Anaerolinea sp.]|nr:hypothetical protein [Anaerolinea sp.]
MEIKLIEFEFGMTQNLGDYTNTRPSVKLVAELAEGDDVDIALESLTTTAVQTVHGLVDDEMEAAGRRVKYYNGPLFRVHYSDVRECVLISSTHADLPQEANWRDRDKWSRASHDHPDEMRHYVAVMVANRCAIETGYLIYESVVDIPALPDPDPEPLWHKKDLEQDLKALRIDGALWEELAALDWVTSQYTTELRRQLWGEYPPSEEIVALIRGNAAVRPSVDEDDEEE